MNPGGLKRRRWMALATVAVTLAWLSLLVLSFRVGMPILRDPDTAMLNWVRLDPSIGSTFLMVWAWICVPGLIGALHLASLGLDNRRSATHHPLLGAVTVVSLITAASPLLFPWSFIGFAAIAVWVCIPLAIYTISMSVRAIRLRLPAKPGGIMLASGSVLFAMVFDFFSSALIFWATGSGS